MSCEAFFWVDTGGIMPLPYPFEQIEQSLLEGNPPEPLQWMLQLGSKFRGCECHFGGWDWAFLFDHFTLLWNESDGWELQVDQLGDGFAPAQQLPYFLRDGGLNVGGYYNEPMPEGFAVAWNLPYRRLGDRLEVYIFSLCPLNEDPKRQALEQAGWHWALPLPYLYDEDGLTVYTFSDCHQGSGWGNAVDLPELDS